MHDRQSAAFGDEFSDSGVSPCAGTAAASLGWDLALAGRKPEPMPRSDARDERICCHEAAHAIVGRALGDTVESITVEHQEIDGRSINGRVKWEPSDDGLDDFNRCIVLVAGAVAELMFCGNEGKLRGSDREKARKHAGNISETEINLLIDAAKAEAERILTANSFLVEALAAELHVRRTMSASDVESCIADEAAKVSAALWLSAGIYRPAKGASR
jgi:ATP-dependent Zn protease